MSYPVGSIPVTGQIGLTAETDTFPTHSALLGKGGHRTVNTLAELIAIPTERREFGMTVRVINDSSYNGTYELRNLLMGGIDNDLTNNNNWKPTGIITSTGDYYVHNNTGVDSVESGSVIKPFKTIQYAISYLNSQSITNATIKVLAGTYTFSDQSLSYSGIIDFADGAIVDSFQTSNTNNYALFNINNSNLTITGKGTFNVWSGVLLYQRYGSVSIQAKLVTKLNNNDFDYLIKNDNPGSTSFLSLTDFILKYQNPLTTTKIKLWDNCVYVVFYLTNCKFNNTKINVEDDCNAGYGGSTIDSCTFYGNTYFTHDYYVSLKKVNENALIQYRYLSIQKCAFDMVSLDATGSAIIVNENNLTVALSKCTFSRKNGSTTVYAIKNVSFTNCKIAMFQNISVAPIFGEIDELLPNQFMYLENADGLRF